MSLVTVNVFSAGSDERRHGWEQDPRRFAYALNDPADLFQRGWKNQFEFQAYNSPVPGTIQLFLQEAGPPHRSWVERKDGSGEGWTPKYNIWVYDKPVAGTTAYYVHACGGGNSPDGPARFEISGNPTPHPAWHHVFTFYAFPAAAVGQPPLMPIHAFTAGTDAEIAVRNPRRSVLATGAEAASMPSKGWTKVHDFQALTGAAGNTAQMFVRDTPGLPQNIISRQAAPPGQHDVLSFHVYNQQAPGTVAFWVVTAGGSGPHDPPRTEVVAAQSPVRPGWRHTDTFYAYPRAVARSLTSVHVFDAEYPRRFGYSLDGIQLTKQGWRKVFSFDAPNTPLPGTFQIFVATTVHPCHRFYTERTPGGSAGWEDLFSFYGYSSPVEGTIAYHVMDIGDPVRHEITTNPTPQPGWNHRFTFYAYPRNPDAPPCNPY